MRFSAVTVLTALLTVSCLSFLAGCGGSSTKPPVVTSISLSPATLSLNEGGVGTVSASAVGPLGTIIVADITFTSSNTSIATISSAGLVCAGQWDSSFINCTPTIGQAGVGQVTITAASGAAQATMTVYVHLQVDRVVVNAPSGCTSSGQVVNVTASAYSTSAPGCSQASPCDITSTVGPFTYSSNNLNVAANSAGIQSTYSAVTNSPTYSSGGSITGTKGQTCNLSKFEVGGTTGIDPIYSAATNSPTYVSGGVVSGSAGQTCNFSNFNGVTGATAVVALTGTNTIATGTHLTITAEGSGATSPPTTSTLTNGTATCSGTAIVITALTTTTGLGSGVIGATATVTLTGTNAIANGTQLTVTNPGYGGTTPPTTATLSNGTATCSGTANVLTALNGTGVLTAEAPGSTPVFATVSGVNSVGAPYITCPVATVLVHSASDSTVSFTLSKGATQPLTADVYDTTGQYIKPPLTWGTSAAGSVTVANTGVGNNPATITAAAPGTATITASCSSPNCNINLPAQYSQNIVTATVTGTTSTTVYAASTSSLTLVPISTDTNSPGTAITLPYLPNSIVVNPAGTFVFLGSSSGLMVVNVSTGAVGTLSVNGTIVAITPDSNYLLLSDSTGNAVNSVNLSTQALAYASTGFTTPSGAYTPDSSFNEWLTATQFAFGMPSVTPTMTTLAYTPSAVNIMAEGGLTYITSSIGREIDVLSTCNQSEVQAIAANNPTLVQPIPNGTGAVAADSPAIDVISISTPLPLNAGCPVTTGSTLTSYDLGAGTFTAQQMFLSPDSTQAWIIPNLPSLLNFNLQSLTPTVIPLANGATPFSGGIRMDGQQVYIGASDNTVHRIDVASLTDAAQIPVALKDSNGNVVAPSLVAVVPH